MIFCCYPGTGKTTAAKQRNDVVEFLYDYPPDELRKYPLSDENLSRLFDYCDQRGKEIEKLSRQYRYLLMQTDFRLFTAMDRMKLDYTIVIPDYRIKGIKELYLQRYIDRGTTRPQFLHDMIDCWDVKMTAFENRPVPKIYLKPNEYVSNILEKSK